MTILKYSPYHVCIVRGAAKIVHSDSIRYTQKKLLVVRYLFILSVTQILFQWCFHDKIENPVL